ncbi:MAG: hypothetical protein NVSMB51_15220 [Solirubrobacteraceae bacterium]
MRQPTLALGGATYCGMKAIGQGAFMHFADGQFIFGAFIILYTLAVIYSLYTRRGSGINQHPYGDMRGDAPGALGSSVLHHDESAATRYTRGTKAGRGPHRRR